MTDINFAIIARDRASAVFRTVGNEAGRSSSMMSKFGKVAAVAAVGVAAVTAAAGVFAYKVGADYVGSLNKIQALTGANDKQMKAAAKALEANSGLYAKMGQTTGDAAGGVVELTKAGLSLHAALKAVNSTMILAKAGEMSVADASTLVANSLNTFHLKASGAAKIANELANAANISSADVSDLAESFKYVAPVAAKAGLSIGQVSGILAELSNSGVKASQAGTTMRGMLIGLEAPGKAGAATLSALGVNVYTASGKMRDFASIINDLHNKLGKLSDASRNQALKSLFGKNVITGATVLIEGGTKALDKYGKGIDKAGAAAALANAKSKGLAGTLAMIKASTISTAQSLYRQYSPAVNDALLKTIAFVGKMRTDAAPALRQFAHWVSDVAAPAVRKISGQIEKNLNPSLRALQKALKDDGPELKQFGHQLSVTAPPLVRLTAKVLLFAQAATGRGQVAAVKFGAVLLKLSLIQSTTLMRAMSAAGAAVSHFAGVVSSMAGRVAAGFNRVVGMAKALPGKIQSAVGNLGNLLPAAGRALIQGLENGIDSMTGGLLGKVASLAGKISGAFKHVLSIHSPSRVFRSHGQAIMDGLILGIADRQIPLQTALARVTGLISKVGGRISALTSARAGFKSMFGADSVFGVDLSHTTTDAAGNDVTTPGTAGDALAYQKQQAAHARQLLRDITRVTKMGLSKALVRQLEAQGASGAATLHALAGGTPAQIKRLNALNKQTSESLQRAGMRAGNYVRGGSVAADLRRAQRQDHILEQLAHHLKDLAASEKKGQTIVVEIDSEAVITAIRRRNKRKGVKSAGV